MSSRPRTVRRRWLLAGLAVVLAVALEVAIRAGEPPTVGPSGVDMLQVPWADPDPDDFVSGVDHPWLPLEPGSRWAFDDTEVIVAERPYEVGGIEATVVVVAGVERYVAEDSDGNVWLLGERGHRPGARTPDWSVADGSPAGLVLPAVPRRGDGWVTAAPGGEVHRSTRVDELHLGQDAGPDDDRLVLVLTTQPVASPTGVATEVEVRLARGRGLVEVVEPGGEVLVRQD